MPPSNPINPKGGVNHISIDYLSPITDLGPIVGIDKPSGGAEWWTIDNTLKRWIITGDLSVSGNFTVVDEPYGAAWNGSTGVPTKNAVYDKIQALSGGVVGPVVSDAAYGGGWDGSGTLAPSQNAVFDKIQTLSGGVAGPVVSNAAYGGGWNGVANLAPSQDAVYDKFESLYVPSGSWTPTLVANGGTPIYEQTIATANYSKIGPFVFIRMSINFWIGAPAGANIFSFNLPVTSMVVDGVNTAFGCALEEGLGKVVDNGGRWRVANPNEGVFFKPGVTPFDLGPNCAINIQGFYRVV